MVGISDRERTLAIFGRVEWKRGRMRLLCLEVVGGMLESRDDLV